MQTEGSMEKLLSVLVVLCMAWSAGMVSASSLVYQPENISLTIPAGGEEKAFVKGGVESANSSTYYLFFLDKVIHGNLPPEWLTVSPASAFLFGGSKASSLLTIRVPEGTPAGVYAANIQSRAMASHDIAQPGNGIRIEVTVPSQCSGVPIVAVNSVLPQVVWPPDHSMSQVVLAGTVQMPDECTMAEAGYAIDDEYGLLSGIGSIQVAASGSFTVTLPVEAMRHGQDKDGRHYSITVYAKNEAGAGSSLTQTIVVPHDRTHSGNIMPNKP